MIDEMTRIRFENENAAFEHKAVIRSLKTLGLMDHLDRLRDHSIDHTNHDPKFSFEQFNRTFPRFPIELKYLAHVKDYFSTFLLKPNGSNAFRFYLQRYEYIIERREFAIHKTELRPLGLIFRFAWLRGGLVIHNAALKKQREPDLRQWVYDREVFHLQRWPDFMRDLKAGGLDNKLEVEQLKEDLEKPDKLEELFAATSPTESRVVLALKATPSEKIFDADGSSWDKLNVKSLAKVCSVTQKSIRRALVSLEDKQLITTKKEQNRLCVRFNNSTQDNWV